MSFDWDQYFILAQELVGRQATSSDEAKKRSAISRAYYAVLLQARAKISKRSGDNYPRGGTHAWTVKKYKKDPAADAKHIGSRLKRLKKRRERADYEDMVPNLDKEVRSTLTEAKHLLQRIDQLSANP